VKTSSRFTLPWNGLAAGFELETGDARDGAVGAVFAGNPFGIVDGQRAGLDGDHFVRVQQLLRGFGGIDGEQDGLRGEREGSGEKQNRGQEQP